MSVSKNQTLSSYSFPFLDSIICISITQDKWNDRWSDQSIALLLFFMSDKSRDWYLRKKQNQGIVISLEEVRVETVVEFHGNYFSEIS